MERPKPLLMYGLEIETGASTTQSAFNGGRSEEGCLSRSWMGCWSRLSRLRHCGRQPWEGANSCGEGAQASATHNRKENIIQVVATI
jgi:hypothetical protein